MKETILSLEEAAMERWRNGDPWGFVELCAEEVSYTDPGRTSRSAACRSSQQPCRRWRENTLPGFGIHRSESGNGRGYGGAFYNYRSSILGPDEMISSQTSWNATDVYFRRHEK
jgi:hypothetical protein